MVPDRSLVTKWLIDLLKADPVGYGVGDHGAPEDVAFPAGYPYWTVYSIPGGGYSGPPMGAHEADASYVYQVDSVGLTRDQAESMGSRAHNRVSGRGIGGAYAAAAEHPSGMVVSDRISEGSPGAPVPEGSYPNEVWTVSERFVISVTPA